MNEVKNITVVGGGTAGWLTATYFARAHPGAFNVTIIDKKEPERIGVGEATLLSFPSYMRSMGFQEHDWMSKVDSTLKGGILFPGWGKKDKTVWHPFGFTDCAGVPMYDAWTNHREHDIKSVQPLYETAIQNKIELDYIKDTYANHIDCGLLVKYLMEETKGKLNYIKDNIDQVIWDGENVHAIITENGTVVNSDLFIDCSGFNRVLGKHHKRIDLDDRLFVNTAVAGRVEYKDKTKEMLPFTKCEAVSDGWIWTIPTRSRMGTGLVFNRNITDPEDAKTAFVEYWDNRISRDDLKVINWDPYHSEKHWVGNVVFCGLSAGFIEPLESTGLALMIRAGETLMTSISGRFYHDHDRDMFNANMKACFETAIDYVNMHYSYCEREEPFWQYVREKHKKSDMQILQEELLTNPQKSTSRLQKLGFFGGDNWTAWLSQIVPNIPGKTYYGHMKNAVDERFDWYLGQLKRSMLESISHETVLKNIDSIGTRNQNQNRLL